ncbi:hypothetical protein [Aquibium sp. ELW1220]|uniref:hypothetical protein n=1 Tax=Aquibium sp. ELW1220 TaxID=2976766 RepID=UPI0025B1FC08|nr:hypothetical protein [Aquibium sp. ELW1220]MDN2580359.1 hypothetical protein [Aquibium sp. ELW1220]
MSKGQSLEKELQQRLANFRPSDRDRLKRALTGETDATVAESAIRAFVIGWEDKSWVEAYSIERMGKWLAVNAPEATVGRFDQWARERQTIARKALRAGLRKGRGLSLEDRQLLISS